MHPLSVLPPTPDGHGYWLVGADGGVFTFGDAAFAGSDAVTTTQGAAAVGLAAGAGGYWIAYGPDGASEMIPAIARYVATRSDNVTVAVENIRTGQILQFRPGLVEHTASTLKVDILATLLTQAQAAGRSLTPAEQALAVPMIEDSLDSAADALWVQLGPAAVGAFERAAGMTSTTPATDGIWGTTTTTALDRLAMIRTVAQPNGLLSDASRAYILNLMEHINSVAGLGSNGRGPPRRHGGVEERVRGRRRMADQHHGLGRRGRTRLLHRRADRWQRDRVLRHRHGQCGLLHRLELACSLTHSRTAVSAGRHASSAPHN